MDVFRGEIYAVYLDPVFGHELGGYKLRPVLVLSVNDINKKPLTITVVPGTSANDKQPTFKNVVLIAATAQNGLDRDTIFLFHQVRALDKGRFTARRFGQLSGNEMKRVEDAVKYALGLDAVPSK
jgi:mRNA interferase MazF